MTQQTKKNRVNTLHGVYLYVVEVEVVYVRKLFGKNVNYRVSLVVFKNIVMHISYTCKKL